MAIVKLIADALYKTDKETYLEVSGQSQLQTHWTREGARKAKYKAYATGDHDSNLTEDQKKAMNITSDEADLNENNANYAGIILDKISDRIATNEITSDSKDAEEWLEAQLVRNRWEQKASNLFRSALRDGVSYMMVDPLTALWVLEDGFDGQSGMITITDEYGLVKWACKVWQESEQVIPTKETKQVAQFNTVVRLVVYQPNSITRWKAGKSETQIVKDTDSNGDNVVVWDLGLVPIVQFKNKENEVSEIKDILPLQNILNNLLQDQQVASRYSAFKVFWVKGFEMKKRNFMPGSITSLFLTDSNGKLQTKLHEYIDAIDIGEFNPTDMSNYTIQMDKILELMTHISGVPLQSIKANGVLSGETLKQQESTLVAKVQNFQRQNTESIKILIRLTALITKTYRNKLSKTFKKKLGENTIELLGIEYPEIAPKDLGEISIGWKSAEVIDIRSQVTTLSELHFKNPDVFDAEFYMRRIGAILGLTQSEIEDEIQVMRNKPIMSATESINTMQGNEEEVELDEEEVEGTEE